MTLADSMHSMPPPNTSASHSRRSILGAIAAAAAAVAGARPTDAAPAIDPIYAVIERHRRTALEHTEAVNTHMAFEESNMQGEELGQYKRLVAATEAVYVELDDAGCDLINTKATTLPGLLALCQYIKLLFAEDEAPDLPEYILYDDGKTAYPAEAFAHTIGRSIEEMMKAERTV